MMVHWVRVIALWLVSGVAAAQLRLPSVPLTGAPLQSLQRGIGYADSTAQAALGDARHLAAEALKRANPGTIAADPRGEPVVRDEILAYAPSELGLAAARALGLETIREQRAEELDWHLVVFRVPGSQSLFKALRQLRAADPMGTYDFNHVYFGSGALEGGVRGVEPAGPTAQKAAAADASGHGARIGLVDSGVDGTHPAFAGTKIHRWGCEDRVIAAAHGTAVASLLVGEAAVFHGVLQGADLYAADVYCGAPTGGAVDALAAAFTWLVHERVAVINVSLVGPDNALLSRMVAALAARGYAIVAAVGNDGPAAPPLYPASYPHVVGVTGVDAHRRVLLEAARGPQVMFAAPGADMAAAALEGRYVTVRGTSFAAPVVAGLIAGRLDAPDIALAPGVVLALAQSAIDLGTPGRDLTYGFGLLGADAAVDPKRLIDKQ